MNDWDPICVARLLGKFRAIDFRLLNEMIQNKRHIGFLDGIRGGAAFWVMCAHCMFWGGWHGLPLPDPKIAVDIFMIASGFLMIYQYRSRENAEDSHSLRTASRFWLRRFFRIAPVYYLCLIFIMIFWASIAEGYSFFQLASPEHLSEGTIYDPSRYHVDFWNTLIHATFLFGLLPEFAYSNGSPDWSIGLEMQFYAVFPLLFWLFRKVSWVWTTIACTILSIICVRAFAQMPGVIAGTHGLFPEPTFLLLKLPLFVIGMLAGESYYTLGTDSKGSGLMAIVGLALASRHKHLVAIVTATIFWMAWANHSKHCHEKMSGPGLSNFVSSLLDNPVASYMANTSYGVYLVHGFVISLVGLWFSGHPNHVSQDPLLRTGVLFCIVCPASYITAWVIHVIVEKPGIRLGRHLIGKYLPSTGQMAHGHCAVSALGLGAKD